MDSKGVCDDWPSIPTYTSIFGEKGYDRKDNSKEGVSCSVRKGKIISLVFWYKSVPEYEVCRYAPPLGLKQEASAYEVIDILGEPFHLRVVGEDRKKYNAITLDYVKKGISFIFSDGSIDRICISEADPDLKKESQSTMLRYQGDVSRSAKLRDYARQAQIKLDKEIE